jgi:hypothetical protein
MEFNSIFVKKCKKWNPLLCAKTGIAQVVIQEKGLPPGNPLTKILKNL